MAGLSGRACDPPAAAGNHCGVPPHAGKFSAVMRSEALMLPHAVVAPFQAGTFRPKVVRALFPRAGGCRSARRRGRIKAGLGHRPEMAFGAIARLLLLGLSALGIHEQWVVEGRLRLDLIGEA